MKSINLAILIDCDGCNGTNKNDSIFISKSIDAAEVEDIQDGDIKRVNFTRKKTLVEEQCWHAPVGIKRFSTFRENHHQL